MFQLPAFKWWHATCQSLGQEGEFGSSHLDQRWDQIGHDLMIVAIFSGALEFNGLQNTDKTTIHKNHQIMALILLLHHCDCHIVPHVGPIPI